jgi:hypothetical protein
MDSMALKAPKDRRAILGLKALRAHRGQRVKQEIREIPDRLSLLDNNQT